VFTIYFDQFLNRVTPVETNAANVVDICNTGHRIPVRSPENSTQYFVLLNARVQIVTDAEWWQTWIDNI